MAELSRNKGTPHWREQLHEIIFESDTRAGRVFDEALIVAIFLSVLTVLLESVNSIRAAYGPSLRLIEWFFTILFTIEFILRLVAVRNPFRYARSFFGIVDLISILPTYLSLFIGGVHVLLVVRVLRLLRLFRIFKMVHYVKEANVLLTAIRASMPKITVFLGTILSITVIVGAMMHMIEGPASGFDSIPRSMYWAIVTLTTVGYGDIAPITVPGQMVASLLMIMGYGVIAVPTGIVSVELARATRTMDARACPSCGSTGHDVDAAHCKYCGERLE